MINYEEIIEGLTTESVINLMTKLGADRYKEEKDYILFPTICHNIDSSEASLKLYFYKNTKLFVCYTNEGTMSIFKFLKTYYETRQIEYDWYNDIYRVILDYSNFNPKEDFVFPAYKSISDKYQKNKNKELPEYSKGVLDCFIKKYPVEWLQDGISKEAMDKYNIRFSISQNKIIIPHYDVNGRLIGIRGRALDPYEIENVGKYMPIRVEKTWYTHPLSLNLYGLYQNKENIRRRGICYLVESEKAVMQAESFTEPNCCVAVCGSNFNKFALSILIRECSPSEIIVCFDNEEKEGEDKYFNKLYTLCEKYKNYANFSFVYDRQGLTKLKESPTDRGERIFRELINRRVRVR